MHCTNCGASIREQDRFCPNCGTRLSHFIYAGFWRRFFAFIIDNIIINLAVRGLAAMLGLALFESIQQPNFPLQAVSILLTWIYHASMESSKKQATVGKMALGIIVTDTAGERLSFARASGRFFGKILSSLILLIGFIMAAFTKRKQALHDILADTLVVLKTNRR